MAAKKTRKLAKNTKKKAATRAKASRRAAPPRKTAAAKLKKKPRAQATKRAKPAAKKAVRKAAAARATKRVAVVKKRAAAKKAKAAKPKKKVAVVRAKRAPVRKAQSPTKKRVKRAIAKKKSKKVARKPARAAERQKARAISRKKKAALPKVKRTARPVAKARPAKRVAKPARPKRPARPAAKVRPAEKARKKSAEAREAREAREAKEAKEARKSEAAAKARAAREAEEAERLAAKEALRKAKAAKKDKEARKEKEAEKAPAPKEKAKALPLKEKGKVAKERPVEEREPVAKEKGGKDKKDKKKGKEGKLLKADKPREGRLIAVREPAPRVVALPLPLLPPQRRATIEERSEVIEKRLTSQSEEFQKNYTDRFDMSWIFHDSALEGVVYTFEELRTALSGYAPPVSDTNLQPTYDDIRRHKEAIEFVRDYGKKKLPITIDVIKKIYLILHPEEGDIKTVKYRKDIPQHRLYFHEYAPPDKIAYKVRQIVDWLNDPETRKTRNGLRIAARAHYDLLRVYPFQSDSGKVARLFMNLLLIRSGLPPSIIHSTERQRYYEALKGSATTVLQMVQEAVENALSSVEKLLDEYETRKRAFVS
ncbi:Fic family protein [Polyangium jinanense]|uniref:Fic family protein n=1 Tax=Polyangium jinanense TaxID=2829994 RepID=A0A9X3XG96_9BACT|nr:Fic family protein [Polyangium jinanense]MDC3957744.1 Fic family protein [Polyangium jinanense]MDC3987536.1 Fic family protein [Polyangium jinanense]